MTSSRDQQPRSAAPRMRRRRRRSVRAAIGQQTFIKVGLPVFNDFDVYRIAVSLNTRRFLALFIAAELTINVVFAGLYMLGPGAISNQSPPGFLGAFFFSLETLATVGYGEMFPGSLYGHIVSSTEILVGVAFTALMTGLLFVRFSKPRSKVVYADHPVVTTVNGKPTFMLRLGNANVEPLHNAIAVLHVLTIAVTPEGIRHAYPVELKLLRDRLPVLAVTWNLMHVIDETSPLFKIKAGGDEFQALRFFLTLDARDPTIGQEIADLHTFMGSDIAVGMRYVDAISAVDSWTTIADFSLLSAIEPEPMADAPPPP